MKARKPALGFIFITMLLDVLGFSLLIPVGPKLVESMLHGGAGGTEQEAAPVYATLQSTFYLFSFFCAPLLGVLSDRFGRRPVILISLLGSGIDFFAQALAPNLTFFFITRAINGISGANVTVCTAYVADISPPEKRAASIGLLFAAFGVGFTLGPLMGGWLGGYGLRVPFFVAGAITIVNWIYGCFVLPESLPEERRTPAIRWGRANPIGSLAGLTRYPVVFGLAWALFLLNASQFSLHATWVLSWQHRFDWSPRMVGFSLFAVGFLSMIVQGGLVRKIVPALGERRAMMLGISVSTLAFVGYGTAWSPWMVFATILFGALSGIAGPAVQAMITKSVRPDEQGTVQGALSSLAAIAGIVGPQVGGHLFAYFISERAPAPIPGAPFLASALMSLVGLLIAAWVTRGWRPLDLHAQDRAEPMPPVSAEAPIDTAQATPETRPTGAA
ncbi:MAG: TCR/Tet family MFS transporter [Phycisphaerales bacterium]